MKRLIPLILMLPLLTTAQECEPPPPPEPEPGEIPSVIHHPFPLYLIPQPDIVERNCGPLDEWQQIDIRSTADMLAVRGGSVGDRRVYNIYPHPEGKIYPSIKLKGNSCAMVRGVLGKPTMNRINMTRSKRRGLYQGGLVIENINVDMGGYDAQEGGRTSGDCIGVPNGHQFLVVRDTDFSDCNHHVLVTSSADQMYLSFERVTAKNGGTHNFYVDTSAYFYGRDLVSHSPGWGSALRCISARCDIADFEVSNVNLDTGEPDLKSNGGLKVGEHPIEVYNCGGPHHVRDGTVNFWRSERVRGSSHAMHYRVRDAQWGCRVGPDDGINRSSLRYGSDEWLANSNWPTRDLLVENVTFNCIGDGTRPNCHALTTWGSHPIANDPYKGNMKRFMRSNDFTDWDTMMDALASSPELIYPNEWYIWTANRVLPGFRDSFLRGTTTNKMPAPVHPVVGYTELGQVTLRNNTYNNVYPEIVRPTANSITYCWTELVDGECVDRSMPNANVTIE